MTIPVPKRVNNQLEEGFYPLQKEELIKLREVKLINNAAYVHLALRYENPFCDRPVQIIPKEFALRWRIPESSVYAAIAKLKDLGILNIKSGKLVIDWIKPEHTTEDTTEEIKGAIALNLNSQNQEKILRSEKKFSDPRIDSQNLESRGLKEVSDIHSSIPQTLQKIQTNQTGGGQEKNSEQEAVQKLVQKSEIEEDLTSDIWADSVEIKVPAQVVQQAEVVQQAQVVQQKTKTIRPSTVKRHRDKKLAEKDVAIPNDLRERLEELEIPLDKKVLTAIANHHISQAYGAAAHVRNTWDSITNPRSVFLYQLPKQPIEKLGSRYSEELLNNVKAQNQAIEAERSDPKYFEKSQDAFAQIRAKLGRKKA